MTNFRSAFLLGNNGLVVGLTGKVARTTDGGKTLTSLSSPTGMNLHRVFIFSDHQIAVGGNEMGIPIVLKSTDNGNSWTPISVAGLSLMWCDFNGLNGVAVGNNGTLLHSTDGGNSWNITAFGLEQIFLNCVSTFGSTVIVVGNLSRIMRSVDGGQTFVEVSNPGTQDLLAVHNSNGTFFAVGAAGTILRSTDNGQTWSVMTSGTPYDLCSVFCINSSTIVACGYSGRVLRSTDGGLTWSIGAWVSDTMTDVFFSSATHGLIVTGGTHAYVTDDGGLTWTASTVDGIASPMYGVMIWETIPLVPVTSSTVSHKKK